MTGPMIFVGLVVSCAGAAADTLASPYVAPVGPVMAASAGRPALARLAEPPGKPEDPWLAQDKLRHFAMSFAATAFAYAGARTALDPDHAAATAAAAALAAGIGKEVHDARAGRWFSLPDMAWNVAGVTLGLAFVRHVR
jgi:uncharacterized protein YfiM (DUF2279 family)